MFIIKWITRGYKDRQRGVKVLLIQNKLRERWLISFCALHKTKYLVFRRFTWSQQNVHKWRRRPELTCPICGCKYLVSWTLNYMQYCMRWTRMKTNSGNRLKFLGNQTWFFSLLFKIENEGTIFFLVFLMGNVCDLWSWFHSCLPRYMQNDNFGFCNFC